MRYAQTATRTGGGGVSHSVVSMSSEEELHREEESHKDVVDNNSETTEVKSSYLSPDKVKKVVGYRPPVAVTVVVVRYVTQADEVSQAEFQKKYGFMKKPITPRKISSVSLDLKASVISFLCVYSSGWQTVL